MGDTLEIIVKQLVTKGKQRGYLTYEEMSDDLPDEPVSPDKLDFILMLIDEEGIELIDQAEADRRAPFIVKPEDTEADKRRKQKKESAAQFEVGPRRIDDPVRMYLTQMGEIPLLTRPEEIALAKKIEMTRMHFRRRVLESDYCIRQAAEILSQVHAGNLPFDRTMKISTAENLSKETISERMPTNLTTIQRIINADQADWMIERSLRESESRRRRACRFRWRRRRGGARQQEGGETAGGAFSADVEDSAAHEKAPAHLRQDAPA